VGFDKTQQSDEDNFCICIRAKLVSQLFQFLAQLAVVFNNAILNHRHSPFSICMRMGVVLLRLAVSCQYVQSQSETGFLCVVVFSQIVELPFARMQ